MPVGIAEQFSAKAHGTAGSRLLQSCRDGGCFDRIAVVALMAGAQLPVGESIHADIGARR
jgi:hypothetical protein